MRRIFTFYLCICACFLSATILHAQGQFSGDLQLNAKFFDTDTLRAAANTPFYDWAKFGSDAWFSLNYSNYENHLEMGVRFDSFNNTDLFSGGVLQNNGSGIGAFYIRKRID
ncbi:MAG: hypothetical protein H6554_11300, partial [Chitinophagales bacterium]|nr:hypothetical protein [Chitinophagales bacterium]